ncbi:hypothetical protein FRC08_009858 [Ceratobasidium sp. 394]|nr:hypothetical protein FRC08_009858 [Ceratobasidium sp. 394]
MSEHQFLEDGSLAQRPRQTRGSARKLNQRPAFGPPLQLSLSLNFRKICKVLASATHYPLWPSPHLPYLVLDKTTFGRCSYCERTHIGLLRAGTKNHTPNQPALTGLAVALDHHPWPATADSRAEAPLFSISEFPC